MCFKWFHLGLPAAIYTITILQRYSYAAFLVHTPITVLLGLGFDRFLAYVARALGSRYTEMIRPVIMTAIGGTGNVLGSFASGKFPVDYVPGMGQTL